MDNVSPVIDEVASMMNVKTPQEELSTQAPLNLSVPVTAILETSTIHILPKEISEFATPVIQSTINESLDNVFLAKSSSQPQSTYEAATSLTEFELKKILLDKLKKSKSYRAAEQHRDLYDALVKSYQLDKDLFDSYGKTYSLKRGHEDKDKDEDPPAGSDQGSSKGSKSQSKSSSKSAQAEEPVFETADIEMSQDQRDDLGNTEDQPNVEEASKHDWFKKPERPSTPNYDWNARKQIDFRPPQTWIRKMAKAKKPPTTFDELMSTPIDFFAYVLNHLKIENLTQEYLVGPAFNLLKGTCKIPINYFFNNDLDYLKGGSSSGKYTTSTTKTKVAKYDNIEGIEDMVQTLWILVKVAYDEHVVWELLTRFKERDFQRLNLLDIEDMLLLLVQKKLSNLERDDLFDLNVVLWMFTRRVVILKQVEDLQLGVESYQKKLNITRPKTFRSDITKMTSYTAYNNPQGIIYQEKFKRNMLMRSDEIYKFCDGTLSFVRRVLHDIASSLEMDYLPKRRWSKLDRKRSRIMIKAIDQQLFERRLIKNLEKFVGGREYINDFRSISRI
ncbi:hypothetical protein Tco_0946459 [Tanacetum coccineum]